MNLYSLRSADGEWRITKFDEDLNQESSYIVSSDECECPQWQGRERQCRHMKMLPMMLERADSAWFFCYEDAQWYDPTGEANIVSDEEIAEMPDGVEKDELVAPRALPSSTLPPSTLKRRF